MPILMHPDEKIEIVGQTKALFAVAIDLPNQSRKGVNCLINLVPVCTFAEEVSFRTESHASERFKLGQDLSQVVVNALDLQLDRVEHVHEIVLLQMRLDQRCSLPDLAYSFPEIGILRADVPDQLLELLGLNLFHPFDAPTIDKRTQLGPDEDVPVEMFVDR